jgi:hypothetical protein
MAYRPVYNVGLASRATVVGQDVLVESRSQLLANVQLGLQVLANRSVPGSPLATYHYLGPDRPRRSLCLPALHRCLRSQGGGDRGKAGHWRRGIVISEAVQLKTLWKRLTDTYRVEE